ncbi:MAG: YdcF family protein [Rhodanobacter sp.]|nr:MAG: YdcF family protein [Rhodanobacter sp.]
MATAWQQPVVAGEPGTVTQELEARLFPTLNALEGSSSFPPALRTMLSERRQRIVACAMDAPCRVKASLWSVNEEKELADWAAEKHFGLMSNSARIRLMGESTQSAAVRELDGLNHILQVYGEGAPPRVPSIDGPDTQNLSLFKSDVGAAVMRNSLGDKEPNSTLDPSIGLSCDLLDSADRLDAIHFEHPDPNSAFFKADKPIPWTRYRYTAILVLGVGPERNGVPLSALSKLNVELAAERFHAGLAPLIITSGGTVHPRRTRFAEAMEMRKALIERYNVPPEVILVDPHARHTTTNIRNATRLLIALHAPLNRDVLTISNPAHISAIESPEFRQRNLIDLGYIPGRIGKRVSAFETTFRPSTFSLRIDPRDPLDP